jgi:hypothetical protein
MNKSALLLTLPVLLTCIYVTSVSGIPARKGAKGLVNQDSLMAVIDDIKKEQGVDNVFLIDPDKVSERLLEKTGEALIKSMPPNPREHEIFDTLIVGRKGLSSLSAVHRVMGYHYLTGDFYGGPGNLSGPNLVCGPAVAQPIKGNPLIAFSARYLALLWFLIITLTLTSIYLLLKLKRADSEKKGA